MHYSVLLQESIELLNIKPDGIYIDGTFGRGGHSRVILEKLNADGRLVAFDKDPEAITYAKENFTDNRFKIIHASFASIKEQLLDLGINQIDGILLDLGVSSPQLDNAERGFSFRYDAPLDMRMDNSKGITAAEWLLTASEEEMADVFWRYGEERFSRRIAKAIVRERETKVFTTTTELAKLVEAQIPYRERGKNPATRVFQAIRIQVNNELGDLEQILTDAPQMLALNGRFVVISFHSLEDRLVKTAFNEFATADKLPKWAMVTDEAAEFGVIAKKVRASMAEIDENSRSRSAVLRCLERLKALQK